jgi:hypothetical protein
MQVMSMMVIGLVVLELVALMMMTMIMMTMRAAAVALQGGAPLQEGLQGLHLEARQQPVLRHRLVIQLVAIPVWLVAMLVTAAAALVMVAMVAMVATRGRAPTHPKQRVVRARAHPTKLELN